MTVRARHSQPLPSVPAAIALLVLGIGLTGCAQMGESMSSAFVDPARYDLYECKQLEAERKGLASRTAELQGLMAKAETGAAGSVVSEVAYRNDYISLRAQAKLADEVWQRNKCQPSPPAAVAPAKPVVPPAPAKGRRSSAPSGSAVY
jgi:hypothetical protein